MPSVGLDLGGLVNPVTIGDLLSFVKSISSYCVSVYISQNSYFFLFLIQFGCTVGTRSADRLLSTFSGFFSDDHLNPGDSGHRVVRMGFHLAVVSLQVPVEAHGKGHVQHIQVTLFSLHFRFSFSCLFLILIIF